MIHVYEITVQNWAKYNPRADRGNFTWFRMDNQFFLHMRQRKGLSAIATQLMGFLLSEASSANGGAFKMRVGFAAEMLGRSSKEVVSALEELTSSNEILSTPFKPLEAAPCITDGRTDVTERTEQILEAVASSAPRREEPARSLLPDADGKLIEVFKARGVTEDHQRLWLDAFPNPEWVSSEIRKALAWEATNPEKRKKRFARFVTGWLTRGWDRRKHEPAVASSSASLDAWAREQGYL